MTATLFRNARLVLPGEVLLGCLRTAGGRIAALDCGATGAPGGMDLDGDYLLPGLVELHTDNFERHLMPRPKVHWAEMPALLGHDAEIAAAGITTVFDALGVGEADTDSLRGAPWDRVLEAMDTAGARDLLRAEHHLHVRCELPAPNTVDLFTPFHGHPRLSLISLMDHTPGQRQWENLAQARIYYTGKKGWSHEKFERQVAHSATLQAQYAQPHRAYFVDYCRTHGIALASHDDTTAAHVAQAHAEGAALSEFPTTLAAARAAHERGLLTVMGGPNVVRGGSHSGNVAAAELARAGLLDILSSDYVPGSLLSAVMQLVQDQVLALHQAVATVTCNPARAAGMPDRGELAPGLRADLVQVHMAELPDGNRQAVVRGVWREGRRVL
ncbi:alpha-D-ribose 1-methylphosphonate 5-triphosphate diphosphatase [Verminephrobacter aporrectodeae subsp. tuberculatae]|uniref:alpha-D-ribose 1-methylphosphonate 5-triphosphate diphosphatase n=1 Tax=Verminephrobacter aporrectodeae TaxID=1110389 RepID=UPI0022445A88|nr:alpha-D-ribose 1-methylphosphonate 5-triphosphate diphosphatase [Verminephrobacter aporrectodeae]MCW8198259.1 alpha-D-ribose 1-methylphosphonate 5-triphosphate diphosphatase [Verminephrobacter aporrectodeae subsp. tuberculatae]